VRARSPPERLSKLPCFARPARHDLYPPPGMVGLVRASRALPPPKSVAKAASEASLTCWKSLEAPP